MVVRTQEKHADHRGSVGLHIGALNVQQHFPRNLETIELELDHLRIVCALEPSFWGDSPVIHDQRLSLWLEAKRTSGKLEPRSAPVAMIPLEKGGGFRVKPISNDEAERVAAAQPSASASAVFVAPSARPGVLLDRRQLDAEREPDRRRSGRRQLVDLAEDERTPVAANN